MDKESGFGKVMQEHGIHQFTEGDVLAYNPEKKFDLVIALNPCLSSRDLTRNLEIGGYTLANNWHNNATQLLEDESFEGIGTIVRAKSGIFLAERDFSRLEPAQFATYFYVFRRTK